MAGLRFTDLQSRPMEFLDFTSLTLDEFQQLVSPFEAAFHARMAAWRMDGKPRLLVSLPSTKTAPCRHQKIGCSSYSPTSRPMRSRWCTGAYSAWSRAKLISGSTSSCRRCSRHCAPSAMPRLAP